MDNESLIVQAPAKLNLFFEVLGKRPDGYHEIQTITAPISLFDTLEITLKETPKPLAADSLETLLEDSRLACFDENGADLSASVPTDRRNLVMKALLKLAAKTGKGGAVSIRLTKRIPSEAGLGGGSSDAASALWGLNRLWKTGLTREELQKIGGEIGSDVPLFFEKKFAAGRGRGEQTESLPDLGDLHFILYKPPFGLSTAEVYAKCGQFLEKTPRSFGDCLDALKDGDREKFVSLFFNRLEEAALAIRPELTKVRDLLSFPGVTKVQMTGSGTVFFAFCPDAALAETIIKSLQSSSSGRFFAVSTVQTDLFL